MEQGGPYKGQRSYPVALPKRRRVEGNKRRVYIHDSSVMTNPEYQAYLERVSADGGILEATTCLQIKLYELKY